LPSHRGAFTLLFWAIVALVISLIAGALGFTGVAAGVATISRVLFGLSS
jgi:uncharacterized membrane protein YtjA (UPF0391 family)